jgi:hypothetical protein
MNKTDITKAVVAFVVGAGTSKIVKEIIKNNTTPDKVTDKAAIMIASYVLGAIAADASKQWTDAKIDKLIAWWTDKFKAMAESTES